MHSMFLARNIECTPFYIILLQTHAQRLAFHELLVRYAVAVELFAAERHALDVELRRRCAVGLDGDIALRIVLRIEM